MAYHNEAAGKQRAADGPLSSCAGRRTGSCGHAESVLIYLIKRNEGLENSGLVRGEKKI